MKRESHGFGEEALVGKKGRVRWRRRIGEGKKKKSQCSVKAYLLPLTERCFGNKIYVRVIYLYFYFIFFFMSKQ
jgi:hypothetical protein